MKPTSHSPSSVSGGASSSGAGGGSSSRWNPTKEQLSMLEGLYGQGIRTPSAEQIQSITKRLQIYGHIEGKNVFYWFQNHKARQRQKQKMDQINNANMNNNNIVVNHFNNNGNAAAANAAYFNRFYYPSPPVSPSVDAANGSSHLLFPASPHSVTYNPYYIAQPEFGFYPHTYPPPKMVLPNHILNNNAPASSHRPDIASFVAQNPSNGTPNGASYHSNGQVTLDLFPVHPTGILQHREHRSPSTESSTENSFDAAGSDQDRTLGLQAFASPSGVQFDVFSKVGK